jgi:hypothetical protein
MPVRGKGLVPLPGTPIQEACPDAIRLPMWFAGELRSRTRKPGSKFAPQCRYFVTECNDPVCEDPLHVGGRWRTTSHPLPAGAQIPIGELADVRAGTGPMVVRTEQAQLLGYVNDA